MKKDIALLIFARSPLEESKHKAFQKSALFFEAQQARLLQLDSKLKIDVLVVDEHAQIGNSFAERFCNAIQQSFQKGYQQLICIGNDSPHLQLKHLQGSLDQLQHGKSSLGLNNKGGFYLLAFHKNQFNYKQFLAFSWNTSKVGKEVFEFISEENSINLLPRLTDVNNALDFKRLRFSSYTLYVALQKILLQFNCYQSDKRIAFQFTPGHFFAGLVNKAPPISF